jgi:ABC-type polar amino acid transport system ATPase subunit
MLIVTHEMGFAREVSSHVMFLHRGVVKRRARRPRYSSIRRASAAGPSSAAARGWLALAATQP